MFVCRPIVLGHDHSLIFFLFHSCFNMFVFSFVSYRLHGATDFLLRPDLNVNPCKLTLVLGHAGKFANKPVSTPADAIAVYSEGKRIWTHRRPSPEPMIRYSYHDRSKYLKLTPAAEASNKKRYKVSDYMLR